MKENKLQHEIVLKFNRLYPNKRFLLFAVNNNPRNAINGAQLVGMGLVAGVSDLILLGPHATIVFIELKTPEGRLSKQQQWFATNVVSLGYRYEIVRSVDEFFNVLYSVWTEQQLLSI